MASTSSARPVVATSRRYVSRLVTHNSNFVTVLLLTTSTVQAVTNGYDASMMNALNILTSYTDYFHLTTATLSLNMAALWIGGMIAGFFSGQVCGWLGQKPVMFIGAVISMVGVDVSFSSQQLRMLEC